MLFDRTESVRRGRPERLDGDEHLGKKDGLLVAELPVSVCMTRPAEIANGHVTANGSEFMEHMGAHDQIDKRLAIRTSHASPREHHQSQGAFFFNPEIAELDEPSVSPVVTHAHLDEGLR